MGRGVRGLVAVRFSLAQLLTLTTLIAVLLSCIPPLYKIWKFRFPPRILDLRVSPNGATAAMMLSDYEGHLFWLACDAASGKCSGWGDMKGREAHAAAISADCSSWAALFEDGRIEFGRTASADHWSADTSGEFRRHFAVRDDRDMLGLGITISGDGTACAVYRDARIAVLNVASGKQIAALDPTGEKQTPGGCTVYELRLNRDGTRLAAALFAWRGDCEIDVWTGYSGRPKKLPSGAFKHLVRGMAWVGDDALAYCEIGETWGRIAVQNVSSGIVRRSRVPSITAPEVERHIVGHVRDPVSASADGATIVATARHSEILVYDGATLSQRRPPLFSDLTQWLALSADGTTAVAGRLPRTSTPAADLETYVADIRSGVVRALHPYRDKFTESLPILIPCAAAVVLCVWLFIRTAP